MQWRGPGARGPRRGNTRRRACRNRRRPGRPPPRRRSHESRTAPRRSRAGHRPRRTRAPGGSSARRRRRPRQRSGRSGCSCPRRAARRRGERPGGRRRAREPRDPRRRRHRRRRSRGRHRCSSPPPVDQREPVGGRPAPRRRRAPPACRRVSRRSHAAACRPRRRGRRVLRCANGCRALRAGSARSSLPRSACGAPAPVRPGRTCAGCRTIRGRAAPRRWRDPRPNTAGGRSRRRRPCCPSTRRSRCRGPARAARERSSMPTPPDCEAKPTRPVDGGTGEKVAFMRTAGSVFTTPTQFGPTSRIPAARHTSTRSRCTWAPPSSSAKPPEMTTSPSTPFWAHCCATSSTSPAGTATTARSTGPGMSRTLGCVARPAIVCGCGFTG